MQAVERRNRRYLVTKGGLAWLLYRQKQILEGEVVGHWFNRGLRVYWKEVTEGEPINNRAIKASQSMTWQYAVLGVT